MSQLVERAVSVDPRTDAGRRWVQDVESMSDADLRSMAALGARLLDRSADSALTSADWDDSIGRNLRELRRWAGRRDGDEDAGARVEEALGELRDVELQLRAGGAAIAQEQVALRTQLAALARHEYFARQLDGELGLRIDALESADSNRAAALRGELLLAVRRRHQEILTQQAIGLQGQAALEVIARNNDVLLRAIQQAMTSALSALQTARAVRQALAIQEAAGERLERARDAVAGLDRRSPQALEQLRRAQAELLATIEALEHERRLAAASTDAVVSALSGKLARAE